MGKAFYAVEISLGTYKHSCIFWSVVKAQKTVQLLAEKT